MSIYGSAGKSKPKTHIANHLLVFLINLSIISTLFYFFLSVGELDDSAGSLSMLIIIGIVLILEMLFHNIHEATHGTGKFNNKHNIFFLIHFHFKHILSVI